MHNAISTKSYELYYVQCTQKLCSYPVYRPSPYTKREKKRPPSRVGIEFCTVYFLLLEDLQNIHNNRIHVHVYTK